MGFPNKEARRRNRAAYRAQREGMPKKDLDKRFEKAHEIWVGFVGLVFSLIVLAFIASLLFR